MQHTTDHEKCLNILHADIVLDGMCFKARDQTATTSTYDHFSNLLFREEQNEP